MWCQHRIGTRRTDGNKNAPFPFENGARIHGWSIGSLLHDVEGEGPGAGEVPLAGDGHLGGADFLVVLVGHGVVRALLEGLPVELHGHLGGEGLAGVRDAVIFQMRIRIGDPGRRDGESQRDGAGIIPLALDRHFL